MRIWCDFGVGWNCGITQGCGCCSAERSQGWGGVKEEGRGEEEGGGWRGKGRPSSRWASHRSNNGKVYGSPRSQNRCQICLCPDDVIALSKTDVINVLALTSFDSFDVFKIGQNKIIVPEIKCDYVILRVSPTMTSRVRLRWALIGGSHVSSWVQDLATSSWNLKPSSISDERQNLVKITENLMEMPAFCSRSCV